MRSNSGRANEDAGVSRRAHGRRRTPARILGALCLGLVAVVAGACEGDNLFSGDTPELLPRISNLSAPATAVAGDTISVRVDAFAPHGVAQIAVSLEGAVTRDTIVEVTGTRTQVSQAIRVPVPTIFTDTLLNVRASVADRLGNVSVSRTTQIIAYGPPLISSVSAPASVKAGDVINLEIRASGARRITRVDYSVRGALSKDTSIAVVPAQKSVTQDLTLQVPGIVQDTMLTVSISARDESGYASAWKALDIPLSIDPPVLTIDVPPIGRAGDRLEVGVAATGLRKVSQIRIQLRGAVVRDTVVAADPSHSSFAQTIALRLPGDIMSSDLTVSVFAMDIGGAISATSTAQVYIPTDPPVIYDMDVPGGVFAGQTVDVRVYAQGSRPLKSIDVRFRLATNADLAYSVPGDPPRYDYLQDASVAVPDNPKEMVLVVEAKATDVTNDVSSWFTRVITVEMPDTSSSSSSVPVSVTAAPAPTLSQSVSRLNELLSAGRSAAPMPAMREERRSNR